MSSFHEECGVFGVYSRETNDLASMTYYALFALQHRGQESAGIVVNDDGVFTYQKGEGLISEVFSTDNLSSLGKGNIAVGHVRYATTGAKLLQNIQPLIVNHHKGRMALCHNGNLSNSYALRTRYEEQGAIFHTTTDSEVISYTIVQERLRHGSIEKAVSAAMDMIEGAYSLVISSPQKLIAARDPHGFRPLCYGETDDGKIVFASESCALDAVGARLVRDLLPGEIAVVDSGGIIRSLVKRNCCVTVVPWNTPAQKIWSLNPDGLFLSYGPGNPEDVCEVINTVRQLRGMFPIFGICLGHQILSLSYGAKIYKLKFGHRGGNHPIKNLTTDKIEITSQNHSYAVDAESLKNTPLEVTHLNLLDNTVEGVESVRDRVFGVQYHPESAPGPQDSGYLFDKFISLMKEGKRHA